MTGTQLQLIVKTHYQIHDQENGTWDKTRARKLCELLKITEGELATLIRVSPGQLHRWLEERRTPNAIKLLLDIFERSAFSKYLGQAYETSLFPEL